MPEGETKTSAPSDTHAPGAPVEAFRPMRRREIVRVKTLSALPSLLTLGNGVCGFAAIVLLAKAYSAMQVQLVTGDVREMHYAVEAMAEAVLFILAAMAFDMLDGRVARMTGTDGKFGAELDSLCDAISFGAAPAFFLRVFGEAVFGRGVYSADPGWQIRVLWAVSALYLCCTVLRLARFNVETDEDDDHRTFRGLPSPAAAGAVGALFMLAWGLRDLETGILGLPHIMNYAVPVLGASTALLMVSRVRYPHLINRVVVGKRTMWQLMLLVLGIVGLSMLDINKMAVVGAGAMLAYLALGPLGVVFTLGKKQVRASKRTRLLAERAARKQP